MLQNLSRLIVAGSMAFIPLSAQATALNEINNAGVNQLKAKKYNAAIGTFERALKQNPDYNIAKINLAVAHNNLGLELAKTSLDKAREEFYIAYYLERAKTAQENIDNILKAQKKQISTTKDRLKLSTQYAQEGHLEAALVEAEFAYLIAKDKAALKQVDDLLARVKASKSNLAPDIKNSQDLVSNPDPDATRARNIKVAAEYMQRLQHRLAKAWKPDYKKYNRSNNEIQTKFDIMSDGTIKNQAIVRSCGTKKLDDIALAVFTTCSPVKKLPPELKSPTAVEFYFRINFPENSTFGPSGAIGKSDNKISQSSDSQAFFNTNMAEGRKLYAQKNYTEAEKSYKAAYEDALKQNSASNILSACVCLHSAVFKRNPDEARALYKTKIAFAKANLNSADGQQFVFEYGTDLQRANQTDEALTQFHDAWEAFKKAPKLQRAKAKGFFDNYENLLRKQGKTSEADELRTWLKSQTWT